MSKQCRCFYEPVYPFVGLCVPLYPFINIICRKKSFPFHSDSPYKNEEKKLLGHTVCLLHFLSQSSCFLTYSLFLFLSLFFLLLFSDLAFISLLPGIDFVNVNSRLHALHMMFDITFKLLWRSKAGRMVGSSYNYSNILLCAPR